MKTTIILKKYWVAYLLLFLSTGIFAQTTIFSLSNQTYANLNPEQKINYDKIKAQGVYSDIQFINYNADAINDPNGILQLSFNNFLDAFQFKATNVDYTNPQEFNWAGEFHSTDDQEEENFAKLSFLSHSGGRVIGSIQTNTKTYQIYDLTDGALVLAEYDVTNISEKGCASMNKEVSRPATSSICSPNKTNILIVYTPGAAGQEPDLQGKALQCINDLNRVWAQSNIANSANLAGVVTVNNLVENELSFFPGLDRINWNLQDFRSSSIVQNLRDQYKADIVVFITKTVYDNYIGLSSEIGTTFNNAYVLVTLGYAVSGKHTFTHEINHLYSGRHEESNDSTPGYAHAHTFLTGNVWFIGHRRYTVMYSKVPNNAIEHISNPDVNFLNKPTGVANEKDNARKVREYIDPIAAFYTDQVSFTPTIAFNGPSLCQQNGTASAIIPQECKGPFTYQWSYSDNGIFWFIIPNSNTATINTFVPLPLYSTVNGTFNSRMYRVKVTQSFTGNFASATNTAYYNCPTFKNFKKAETESPVLTNELTIVPNPAKDNIEIQTTISKKETISVRVSDASGKVVLAKSETVENGRQHIKLNTEKLISGVYIVEIKSNGKTSSQKLIISK